MPELFLMWSAAVILAAVAVAAVIMLGFYLSFVAREIGDRLHRHRQRELTAEQAREVRAFAKRLAKENRTRAEEVPRVAAPTLDPDWPKNREESR